VTVNKTQGPVFEHVSVCLEEPVCIVTDGYVFACHMPEGVIISTDSAVKDQF
jgi:hypothetical protein